jgi:hypothetical protein
MTVLDPTQLYYRVLGKVICLKKKIFLATTMDNSEKFYLTCFFKKNLTFSWFQQVFMFFKDINDHQKVLVKSKKIVIFKVNFKF